MTSYEFGVPGCPEAEEEIRILNTDYYYSMLQQTQADKFEQFRLRVERAAAFAGKGYYDKALDDLRESLEQLEQGAVNEIYADYLREVVELRMNFYSSEADNPYD